MRSRYPYRLRLLFVLPCDILKKRRDFCIALQAFAGTLAVSFLFEAVGSNLGFPGWGLVGAIAAMGTFLIYVIEHPNRSAGSGDDQDPPQEK